MEKSQKAAFPSSAAGLKPLEKVNYTYLCLSDSELCFIMLGCSPKTTMLLEDPGHFEALSQSAAPRAINQLTASVFRSQLFFARGYTSTVGVAYNVCTIIWTT